MEDFMEVQELPDSSNGLQVYQQDKALIDMQIATAKRYPRNIQSVIDKSITFVTLNESIAESCIYTLNKGKNITGPSVNLARILAQNMGNMRVDSKVVGYDDSHVTAEATCFDLENNFAYRTQIKRSVLDKDGIRFSTDLVTITGNAALAIAFRNAVFTVVDKAIVDMVLDAAKNKITGKLGDEQKLITKRTSLINGFKKNYPEFNLTTDEIVKSTGRSSINHITQEEIIVLIGFEKSLKAGEMSLQDIFRPIENKIRKPSTKEDKKGQRMILMLEQCATREELKKLQKDLGANEERTLYDEMWEKLT